MDILQWLLQSLQISESELNLSQSLSLSKSLSLKLDTNTVLFLAYLALSVIIKRAAFLAAFFMSCLLFDMAIFDKVSEASLYLLTFAIYSYVIFVIRCNVKATIACAMLLIISITLAYDAFFYGVGGYYGATETFIYRNIESLALSAHIIFICSLINYTRIRNSSRGFFGYIVHISSSRYNMLYIFKLFKPKGRYI